MTRVHRVGAGPAQRFLLCAGSTALAVAVFSGALWWAWSQAACLIALHSPMSLSLADAERAMWRMVGEGWFSKPGRAFATARERAQAPATWAYLLSASLVLTGLGTLAYRVRRTVMRWGAGSPLARERGTLACHARVARLGRAAHLGDARRPAAAVGQRTGRPGGPTSGRSGERRRRMLAAEREVQPMVIAPPRAGKSSGFVVPWMLDHDGPALVLSTKRDIYEATVAHCRAAIGRGVGV